jgi:trimeric autotransporter adhesin
MRKFINTLLLLLIANIVQAQAPQGIPYQAAARNASGAVLASTNISVRFTIRDSIATGAIKYRETHSVTTSAQGMFSLNVGQGSPVAGTFSGINWGTNAKFMQVELDPAGGSSYIDMGTQQMMSVPYSLYSNAINPIVSATGDSVFFGGGKFIIFPGVSAANSAPYAGTITGASSVCAGSTITLANTVTGGSWSIAGTAIATVGSTGIVTGVAAGTTTISYTVTNSFGSSYATKVVTVNALPSAGTITGTATVTAGSTTTLSNATTGGAWSSSAAGIATVGSTGVVTGVAAGTATISYTVTNTCGSAVATRVVTVSAASATVGATYGGGVIAYIYVAGDPGYVAGETHGIIAAPSDQSTAIQWGCYGTTVGGTATALGTGAANTAIVSAACGAGTAARLCADLVLNGYSDWYLPSKDELQKLYINRSYIGGSTTGNYWSSSEFSAYYAWVIYFASGLTFTYNKDNALYVRAVRAFSYPEAITGTSSVCAGSTSTLTSATTGGTWSSSNTGVATVNSSGVVSGVSAGTATISYTATGSLGTGTTTRIVTVNPLPSAGTITGTATVTAGSTTTLSNATTGGAWSSSAAGIATVGSTGVVTGVAAGTATISYTVTNGCGSAVATQVVTVSAGSTTVGSTFGGGVIAYIYVAGDPGYIAGEVHGIIAAPSDQSLGIQWGCYGTLVGGGTSTTLGTGAANTAIVSSACGAGTAARLCADLVLGGYSDWYLPSLDELQKLYINRSSIGGFTTGAYWSSSETNAIVAWAFYFLTGYPNANYKDGAYYVRAVRAF